MSLHGDFADELDRARKASGLSLRALAEKANTTHSYVCNVINRRTCPSLDKAEELMRAVGMQARFETGKRRRSSKVK
jgi:ribosome-binding protein aMBF1 (putative translation factor)